MKLLKWGIPLLAVLSVSCHREKEARPSFGVQEVVFEGDAVRRPQTLKVTAPGSWYLSDISSDWLSVTPNNGEGDAEVTVQTEKVNDTGADRWQTVSLYADGYDPVSLKISQLAATADQLTDGLLRQTQEGYYEKGEGKFVFDPASMQMGLRPLSRCFWLATDDQRQILLVTVGGTPKENGKVYLSIQGRGIDPLPESSLDCTVYKISGQKVWLYNPAYKKGFIVRCQTVDE